MANMVDKLIEIANNEVGYLEKKSNSNLDSKTANAGYNNYTKYARDLFAAGYYNGNKNGYAWCDCFTDWLFYILCNKDAKKAQQMICQTGNLGAGCTYSAQYYRNAGRFYSTPQVGDQIFFGVKGDEYHTGIVYKVDASKVYTIEGNTSGDAGVVDNGGGVFKKSYSRSNSQIAGYGRPRYDGSVQASVPESIMASRGYLMRGDNGQEVKTMQENLIKLNYSCGSYGADGDFGYGTESALKAFQRSNGLVADGLYGSVSKSKMESLLKKLSTTPTQSTTTSTQSTTVSSTKIDTVKEVQNWINANYKFNIGVDGIYGTETKKALVKALQTELNRSYNSRLDIDGICGNLTIAACPVLSVGSSGNIVGVLQAFLICNGYGGAYLDKDFGSATQSAVIAYQRKCGLSADGMAGKDTFTRLCT